MRDNRAIVDDNFDLIMKCVDCQFSKMKDKRYKEDFTNDLILILLSYDNEKMNDAVDNGHFNALVSRIIINNIFSVNSPYYTTYHKFEDRCEENWQYEDEGED